MLPADASPRRRWSSARTTRRPSSCSATTSTADRFHALPAPCAADALRLCRYKQPDLLLLDLRLPDAAGPRRAARDPRLRRRHRPLRPRAAGDRAERPRHRRRPGARLREGADDYVVKPFHYAGARRADPGGPAPRDARREGPLRVGEIIVDPARREVRVGGRPVAAREQGVRAAARARLRADAGLHQGGAAARRLGVSLDGPDPHARLARQPAATQARPRVGPLRRQLLGRRLPADRRRRPMLEPIAESAALAWPLALTLRCGRGRRPGARRAAAATALNRALHELRRPLQALALRRRSAARPAPATLELALAALADLDREVNGGRAGAPARPVAARALAEAAVERWRGAGGARGRRARASLAADGRGGLRARRRSPGARQPARQRARARRGPIRVEGRRAGRLRLLVTDGVDRTGAAAPAPTARAAAADVGVAARRPAARATACGSSPRCRRARRPLRRLPRTPRRQRGARAAAGRPLPRRREPAGPGRSAFAAARRCARASPRRRRAAAGTASRPSSASCAPVVVARRALRRGRPLRRATPAGARGPPGPGALRCRPTRSATRPQAVGRAPVAPIPPAATSSARSSRPGRAPRRRPAARRRARGRSRSRSPAPGALAARGTRATRRRRRHHRAGTWRRRRAHLRRRRGRGAADLRAAGGAGGDGSCRAAQRPGRDGGAHPRPRRCA